MDLTERLKEEADSERAEINQRFFKTGKGQYGEGDVFLGLRVGKVRAIAKEFYELSLSEIKKHLLSKYHEERLVALLILVERFKKGSEKERKEIYDFYLTNASKVNNWDLVDSSADDIVGEFLIGKKDRKVLYGLARSDNLWERRISMISCFAFIRKKDFDDAFEIAKILLNDEHDLIQKAVGWMIREIGNRNLEAEEKFLLESGRYKKMPRTMLRYAIEKFPEVKRKKYLKGEM